MLVLLFYPTTERHCCTGYFCRNPITRCCLDAMASGLKAPLGYVSAVKKRKQKRKLERERLEMEERGRIVRDYHRKQRILRANANANAAAYKEPQV
ncbi:hypothetical protein BUALT_Bualt08G0108200 [Buddleja alternifolia]|uniref:Uncharacterized protein n=1 Tax=Buddleja alternifolia TaxID=168488 RepID=A0AAV6XCG3_9LAMI|nr:hypothetical protein BUALT_Bualt08G0108200 [Buddleja alternifolia]